MSEGSLAPPPAAPAETTNSFQRIVGVLSAPTSTFAIIARRPDVLLPLMISLLIGVGCGLGIASKADFKAMGREAIEGVPQSAQMSPEAIERATKFSAATMKVALYASPVIQVLVLAITAGLLLIAFRLMAGEGDFKQAFSVTTYAWYPRIIKGILATIVLVNKRTISIFDLQDPLRSNPGFLFSPKTQPLQFGLATSFDLFSIWTVVLLIIGFAATSKLSRTKSAVIVIAVWLFGVLISLIGPAFQAMRMHS